MTRSRRPSVAGVIGTITALLFVALTAIRQPASTLADSTPLAITGGTLIDGTGAEPIQSGVVVIDKGTIVAVGPAERVAVPPNAQIVDAQGGTIMPGIVDPHTHFTGPLWEGQDILSPWLQTGVTTVQDLGCVWFLVPFYREKVDALWEPPRVQFAGPIIAPEGGYPNDPFMRDYGVDTVAEARTFVSQLIEKRGVDVIKIAIERGYSIDYDEEGLPVLTPEQVAAITEEAHARGRIVIAHVTDPMETDIAVENGVDVLGHAPVSPTSDRVLRRAIAKDLVMITTVGAWGDREDRPYYALKNAVRYWELGGRIAVGTDYPFQPPSMPLREFRLLSEGGISNMGLILAATRNAAEATGRGDDLGTLEVGKIGDVIVVGGDPLQDIQAMANVEAVVLEGRVVRGIVHGATPTAVPPATTPTLTPVSVAPAPTAVIALPPTGVQSGSDGHVPRSAWLVVLLTFAATLVAAGILQLRPRSRG